VRWIIAYGLGLFLWLPGKLSAQRVIYSEPVHARSTVSFRVIGQSKNFYWVEKLQKQKPVNRSAGPDISEMQSFRLFDAKLNLLREEVPVYFPGTVKQWLVAGKEGLDQIMIICSEKKTKILCSHFKTDENTDCQARFIDSLPFSSGGSGYLLVRSEDKSKILLIAFENADDEFTRVHALLFDSDWNPIYHQVFSDKLFSQPCIQDDEIGFPSESFDNLPVKLADNGEWLMAFPSRISQNFSLFHASSNGMDNNFREIPVSPYYKMEDIAMSIDNDQQEMSVGLLSAWANTSLKNVHICNYSMKEGKFDFDSSYRFNTQTRSIRDKNLSHESFIAVPGAGYLLLKEYGAPFEFYQPVVPVMNSWESAYLLANYAESDPGKEQIKPGYTYNKGLSPISIIRNRGDLNFFYFPAISKDSTWSGILAMQQHAESNNPELSYLIIPVKNKLYIIYNSIDDIQDPLATTTTLNMNGQVADDALVFWKMNKMLNFQHAHRFSARDVSVPYVNNQQTGFAIIRLQ
jgi:hypothetical protein